MGDEICNNETKGTPRKRATVLWLSGLLLGSWVLGGGWP